jgi:hypothetical protein
MNHILLYKNNLIKSSNVAVLVLQGPLNIKLLS